MIHVRGDSESGYAHVVIKGDNLQLAIEFTALMKAMEKDIRVLEVFLKCFNDEAKVIQEELNNYDQDNSCNKSGEQDN